MKDLLVLPNISIKQALKKLSVSGEKCLIVVDENNSLLGTVTDGDLRNSILKGIDIRDSISSIYQSKPTFLVRGMYKLEQVKNLKYREQMTSQKLQKRFGDLKNIFNLRKLYIKMIMVQLMLVKWFLKV